MSIFVSYWNAQNILPRYNLSLSFQPENMIPACPRDKDGQFLLILDVRGYCSKTVDTNSLHLNAAKSRSYILPNFSARSYKSVLRKNNISGQEVTLSGQNALPSRGTNAIFNLCR